MRLVRRLLVRLQGLFRALKRNAKWIVLALVAVPLSAGAFKLYRRQVARGPTQVTVDPTVRFQIIDGWAVYPRYWEDDKKNDRFDRSFEPHTERVSSYLVDELGINAVRIEIWSGLENPKDHWIEHYRGKTGYYAYKKHRYEKVNDNDDPRSVNPDGFQFSRFDHRMKSMVLPIKRALERRGEQPFLNVCYVDFKSDDPVNEGTLSHADNPEEFAEFVLLFFERLRSEYGIVPDTFEVILEPDNTERWRGPQIGRAIVAVDRRLRERGFSPRFVAPSTTSMRNALDYFDGLITVPGALERLDTLSYHRYGIERRAWVEEIWTRASHHRKKTAMLEKLGGDIDKLFEDLSVGNVSGWQQWAVANRLGPEDGGYFYAFVDDRDPGAPRVLPTQTSSLLSQVFRYVRRGAQRLGAESDNFDKTVVAFQNAAGGMVVVVRARRAGGKLTVHGLSSGRYGLRFVDQHKVARELGATTVHRGQPLVTTIPDVGALSVYPL